MSVAVCKVDRSPDTGSLVVCTCGFALGPFQCHDRASEVARAHRFVHTVDRKAQQQQQRRGSTPRRGGRR